MTERKAERKTEKSVTMAEVEETKTQRAARLRREKRAAKIAATGNARLDKITGISGRSMSCMLFPAQLRSLKLC